MLRTPTVIGPLAELRSFALGAADGALSESSSAVARALVPLDGTRRLVGLVVGPALAMARLHREFVMSAAGLTRLTTSDGVRR